jgi:hypothetical protein
MPRGFRQRATRVSGVTALRVPGVPSRPNRYRPPDHVASLGPREPPGPARFPLV